MLCTINKLQKKKKAREMTKNLDLFVHPSFYDTVFEEFNYKLKKNSFNLYKLNGIKYESKNAILITDEKVCEISLSLEPTFVQDTKTSGGVPSKTSYTFTKSINMFTFDRRKPRYIIWPVGELIPFSATFVDRINSIGEIGEAIERAIGWSCKYNHTLQRNSVIVFDLDKTLISRDDKIFDNVDKLLLYARKHFDKMILWSHGTDLHVDRFVYKFENKYANSIKFKNGDSILNLFDLKLTKKETDKEASKNLLHLYNYFYNVTFDKSVAILVDDSPFNWTPEYSSLIVPYKLTNAQLIMNAIHECLKE